MKATTRSHYEAAVRRALARIVAGLDEALDLERLGKEAALAPLHFHRVFRGMVGETPLELKRRLRLERAAHQLAETLLPIARIAFDAGYETHEAFTRSFRQSYGAAPSSFRERVARDARAHVHCELTTQNGLHFDPDPRAFDDALANVHLSCGETAMDVELKDMPELRLLTLRHLGAYSNIHETFARLGWLLGRAGLTWQPDTLLVAVYHDDPEATAVQELRADAAVTVTAGTPIPAELGTLTLPAGRYAHFVHRGAYARLGDTWARFMGDWLPASGHRVGAGLAYEIYFNTPENAPEHELRTGLYVPIDDPAA